MKLDWTIYFVRLIAVFAALPIHEFAHAYIADKLGDHTARYQGRLSINPFVHLDLIGSVALVLAGFGWARPVPINPNNFRNPKTGMAFSAAAGPISNLLMAFVSLIIAKSLFYIPGNNVVLYVLYQVFYIMVQVNISLAIFNLIPIPPLDGSRIATLFLSDRTYFKIMQYEQYIFIALLLLLFLPPVQTFISFVNRVVYIGLDWLTGFVDLIALFFR